VWFRIPAVEATRLMGKSPSSSADEPTAQSSDFKTLVRMEEEFGKRNGRYFAELLRKPLSLFLRIHAVCMLADIADEESVAALCVVLREDPSPLVRHEAAFALGQIGMRSAVQALVEALLKDPSKLVRHESAVALGSLGAESARLQLEQAGRDRDRDVRLSAQVALDYLDYLAQRGGMRITWNGRANAE